MTGHLAQPLVLQSLVLANFKNHAQARYDFHNQLTCITGLNGTGKTNLLDAIYLLALTKSRFQKSDADLIAHGETYYRIAGEWLQADADSTISLAYQKDERKVLKENGNVIERFADHIGRFPVVFTNPDDIQLIKGSAEERRKFFDNLLSQSDPEYLRALLAQNRLLIQRNSLLAQFAAGGYTDLALLESYDTPLLAHFYYLSVQRKACLDEFSKAFSHYYLMLSAGKETPAIRYISTVLEADFEALFRKNRTQDLAAQRTLLGAHRDDFDFLMEDKLIRKVGSQGQQKTFLVALKLAMHDFLAQKTGLKPLLLLDDIFERLDETRVLGLLALVKEGLLGQVFITEATGSRMKEVVAKAGLQDTGWIAL